MLVHCLSSCLSTCLAEETCGVCGEKLWRRNFGRDARSFGSFTTNSFSIWALFELKLWALINGTGTAHLADGQTAFTKRCKRCKVFSENSLCQRAFIKESSLNIPRQRMSAEPRSEYHVNTMYGTTDPHRTIADKRRVNPPKAIEKKGKQCRSSKLLGTWLALI